jgi:transcriptional regulator with GAF, ATPase, and Fis domain
LESANWDEVLLDTRLHDLDVSDVVRLIRSRHPHLSVQVLDLDQVPGDSEESPALNAAPEAMVAEIDEMGASFCDEFGKKSESEAIPWAVEPLPGMIGSGRGLAETYHLARLVGRRQTAVLITGETGTGKELVARGIHEVGARAKGPFVVVNCAAIPEQLLEAELFGHTRGAFTGAVQSRLGRIHAAHGGTLFLDEVGELPLSMQAKLLRFLQDGEVQRLGSSDVFRVDVRVISATNQNLPDCVREKRFRQDLYYRLAVFPIELPALRDRREDIIPLAEHFLSLLSKQAELPPRTLSTAAVGLLRQHSWPGNVRELQHTVERAFILAEDQRQLRAAHFMFPGAAIPLRKS